MFVQVLRPCRAAGLVQFAHVAVDCTKMKATASRYKAMSYGRIKTAEPAPATEFDAWLEQARKADAAEGRALGKTRRGDETPGWMADQVRRLETIRAATAALEAEAVDPPSPEDESGPGACAGRGGPCGVRTAVRPTGRRRNFTNPDSRILPTRDGFVQGYNGQIAVAAHQVNLFQRAQRHFRSGCEEAVSTLRRAAVVASDETGVRIEGSNAYHWVFHAADAVVHTASQTRGAIVVREMMDGHRPTVWISDRYSAQQGHAAAHQTCLAHLARDVAYVVETGDDPVPWRLQLWLQSVFALAERATDLATATLAAKLWSLDRQLGAILAMPSRCDLTRDLHAKIGRARDRRLVFLAYPGAVEPTNNGSERRLRPAVVQRKVTNGYHAMWAAEGEANIRNVVYTARLTGSGTFSTILKTIGP